MSQGFEESEPVDPSDRQARIEALRKELVGGLLLSSSEVAEILGVHLRTVLDYIHSGRIEAWQLGPSHTGGGTWRIPEESLRKFVRLAKTGGAKPDKRSPFDAVLWADDSYHVQVGEAWYRLVGIEGVEFTAILNFSKERYGNRWMKRIDEDLVELMKLRGVSLGATVNLRVCSLDNDAEQVLSGVEMTSEKRQAIWKRNQTKLPDH